jgi:hypothetical protein
MKCKRFFYVVAPGSGVAHITASSKRMEGDKLRCGRRIQVGWRWMTPRPLKMARCKQCEAAHG